MPYKGSDLSPAFKTFFRRQKNAIKKVLEARGCTEIKLDYGFYYFSGFFTAPNGQIYYILSSDVRHFDYERLLIRTAKHYKDYSGGTNEQISVSDGDYTSLKTFRF
jgi:hypothetical protein